MDGGEKERDRGEESGADEVLGYSLAREVNEKMDKCHSHPPRSGLAPDSYKQELLMSSSRPAFQITLCSLHGVLHSEDPRSLFPPKGRTDSQSAGHL